jgi:antitoxin ParD1/3/4
MMGSMSRNTMSFALPESMRSYVDERVRSGEYGNTSEYLRDLIRRDQHDQAIRRLRALIADGVESGEGRAVTDDVVNSLRHIAFTTDR